MSITCLCGFVSSLLNRRKESGFIRIDCPGCTRNWIITVDE